VREATQRDIQNQEDQLLRRLSTPQRRAFLEALELLDAH